MTVGVPFPEYDANMLTIYSDLMMIAAVCASKIEIDDFCLRSNLISIAFVLGIHYNHNNGYVQETT